VDRLTISIPASPQYIGVVRLVAAGIASRLDFTIDDIEDLKIAVDELASYVTGTNGRDGRLEIEFLVHAEDGLEIRGVGRLAPGQKVRTELTEFSQQILETVVDGASLQQTDGVPMFQLTKSKG
jgi:serine/threonine-protein kinase RsbW